MVEGVPTMVGRKCEYGKLCQVLIKKLRRLVRVVEGARLESVYTPKGYRGFESLTLRGAIFKDNLRLVNANFTGFYILPPVRLANASCRYSRT